MTKGKRTAKKVFALLLSFIMVVCMMPSMAFADAEVTAETETETGGTTLQVLLTVQADNSFLCTPDTMAEVSSELAESYGYADLSEGVSALDVMIRAHELLYGESFTPDTKEQYLSFYTDGRIKKSFGDERNAGFTINGKVPHSSVFDDSSDSYVPYTLAESQVNDGDRVSFFVYQDGQCQDQYGYFTDTTVTANKIESLDLAAGVKYHFNLRGYSIYNYGASTDSVISGNTNVIAGAKLCLIEKDTGVRTDLDAEMMNDGRVEFMIEQTGEYFLSAYVPASDISGGKTPMIMPAVPVHVGDAPKLKGITMKRSGGTTEYALSPAFNPDQFEGYTLELPDYVVRMDVYPTLFDEDLDKGYGFVVGTGGDTGSLQLTHHNTKSGEKIDLPGVNPGRDYIYIGIENDKTDILRSYKFHMHRTATLAGLSVDGMLEPEFDPETKEYHAYVDGKQESVEITATPYGEKYTVTIDGEPAESGKALQFKTAGKWSDKGTITVPIKVSYDSMTQTEYTLVLEKKPTNPTPTILKQPKPAGYITGKTVTPLTVAASSDGTLSYQWYSKASEAASEGTLIEGATEASYTPPATTVGDTWYYCVVSSSSAGSEQVTTDVVKISVYSDPGKVISVEITNPGTDTVNENTGYSYNVGDAAAPLKAKVKIAKDAYLPEDAAWSFVWQRGELKFVQKGEYGETKGYKEEVSYCPDTSIAVVNTKGNYYNCTARVTYNGELFRIKSKNLAYVYVKATEDQVQAPVIMKQPVGNDAYIVNESPKALSVSAVESTSNGMKASLSYQWYYNDKRSTEGAKPVPNAARKSFLPPTSDTAGSIYYYCIVTNKIQGIEKSTTSDIVRLTFKENIAEGTWEGEGTEESPYLLKTEEDLNNLSKYVNQGYSFEGKYFALANDITLSGSWVGMGRTSGSASDARGSQILPFSGILDGKNHTLTFAEGSSALFSYVREAVVKDLNIYAPYMADFALVSNYIVDYGPDDDYKAGTGGSYVPGSPDTIDVINVTLKSGSVIKKGGFIGGSASGANVCNFINCTVEDNVKIGWNKAENKPSGEGSVGSFAGSISGTFVNCVSYADLYGEKYVGGMAGAKSQSMGPYKFSNCAFLGSITSTGDYVGGIAGVGYYSASAPNTPCTTIQNCYVNADIVGRSCVGGIFGGERGSKQCWNRAPITDNHFAGTVKATAAGGYVGGIIGYMSSLDKNNVIENNYFIDTCGATKGIGGVDTEFLDLSSERYGRTDDPLGKDADKLAMAMSSGAFSNGEVKDKLNGSDTSFKNWVDGENGYPVHSSTPVAYKLEVSGEYKKDYVVGEQLDLGGAVFTATWSDGKTTEVNASDIEVANFDNQTRGQKTITLSYGAAKTEIVVVVLNDTTAVPDSSVNVTFQLLGDTVHGEKAGVHTLRQGNLTEWVSGSYTLNENDTVEDLLKLVQTNTAGLTFNGEWTGKYGSTYISGVTYNGTTLEEFTNGPNSGWMYTVNGVHPEVGVSAYYLNDGDKVVFHYTDDYTKEEGSDKWSTPSETQPVTQDVAATVNKDNEATSKLTASDVDKLVDAAVKQSATLIEINVKDAEKADKVTVELPKTSVSNIANKTDATLQVTTPAGIVTMDKQVMKEIVKAAEGNDIQIIVEKETPLPELQKLLGTDISYTEVTVLSNGHEIKNFGTAKLKLNLIVPEKIKDKKLMAAHVDENGKLEKMPGKLVTIDGKPFYQIETTHLSHFVVAEESVIDETIKDQAAETDDEKLARIKKGVQNTTIKITKTSKGKGWIKIKWKKSKGYKVDYYEVFRKTGKNSKFGKKAFYKTKKHGMTGSYKNTKALKKGKRYYYKVRGVRVIDGKKYYTKWSKTYYRIAK